MRTTRSVFRGLFFKPFAILLASILTPIGFTASLFLTPVLWLVLFTYRLFIIIIAKCKIPDGRILEKLDSVVSFGTEYSETSFYITLQIILEGHLSVDDVKKEMDREIVNKLNKNGELKYPEMQEYLAYFGGYVFRRHIKNFDINKYIHSYQSNTDSSMIDKLRLLKIRQSINEKLFGDCQPLWELTVCNNYRQNNSENDPECTALIFKFHHTLSDGFGGVNVLYTNLMKSPINLPTFDKSTIKYKFFTIVQLLMALTQMFILLFNTILNFIYKPSRLFNSHDWHKQRRASLKYELWWCEPINKRIFREIKSTCNISVMSVLVNVITGGMRRMMVAKNLVPPKELRISYPVPALNHPGTLTNKANVTTFRVPFSIADCKKRLRVTDRKIKSLNNLILMKYLCKFAEVMPNCLKMAICYDSFNSALVACTPLPPGEVNMFGHKQLSISSALRFNRSTCGCLISVLGVGDNFDTTIQMNSKILDHPDEVRDLEKYMLEELDFIAKECLI